MPASSGEVQPDEPTQTASTAITNQDIKKNDSMIASNDNDKPKINPADELHQSSPLDDKKDNLSTSELKATIQTADSETKKATDPATSDDRKSVASLIHQELEIIKKITPKLGEHEVKIKKKVKDAENKVNEKLKEDPPCDIKELKDLKRMVTKLKLEIPAKYRTYDKSDQQKNQQSDLEHEGITDPKLLEKMPRLQNKWFHQSSFCKTIQLHYYKDLTLEDKLCLLCFSVFPENAIISRRVMVYWWIADGFINPGEDYLQGGRSTEDYANDIFKKLVDNEFIEPLSKSYGRYVAFCKMKPMVRAALVMIAEKVSLFDFDKFGDAKDFGKFGEIEIPEDMHTSHLLDDPREFFDFFIEGRNKVDETIEFNDKKGNKTLFFPLPDASQPVNGKQMDGNSKHYFYKKKEIKVSSSNVCLMGSGLSKGIPWEKLHMLFNVKDEILQFKQEWFAKMINANILFLGRWQKSEKHHIEVDEFDFKDSLEHMKYMRFISFQGVSRVSELPNSISKLEKLLILDLRACHNLEVIPSTIGLLKCLTHLDMSGCYLLKYIPKEISSLVALQVLKGFVVIDSPEKHVCALEDLKKLRNLRKLSMYTYMKDFPQESHLDDLQKMDMLRKLTILWADDKSDKSKKETKNKQKFVLSAMKVVTQKTWLQGSMKRMKAFKNYTLGSQLEKLDLKCFPNNVTPDWLSPASLKGLKKLYIRGGNFADLGQYQDILECDNSKTPLIETWNVEILRLKYLDELKMEWKELQNLFPRLTSVEKVKCPRLTLFPCNEHGVWTKKVSKTT